MPARECSEQPYPGLEQKSDIQGKHCDLVLSPDGLLGKHVFAVGRGRLFSQGGGTHAIRFLAWFCTVRAEILLYRLCLRYGTSLRTITSKEISTGQCGVWEETELGGQYLTDSLSLLGKPLPFSGL